MLLEIDMPPTGSTVPVHCTRVRTRQDDIVFSDIDENNYDEDGGKILSNPIHVLIQCFL